MKSTKTLLNLLFSISILLQLEAKVYDCFPFFGEVDLLEVRLQELYPYVDTFVIVEGLEGHSGLPHDPVYPKNLERFARFADKIIYIQAPKGKFPNAWEREYFQKNYVMRGLKKCAPSDLILTGDVDEFIPGKLIPKLVEAVKITPVIGFRQTFYRHFFNRITREHDWNGTVAITYECLCKTTPVDLRTTVSYGGATSMPSVTRSVIPRWNAGWHFSSFGDFKRFHEKCLNWTHWENPSPQIEEHWRGEVSMHRIVPIDETYPQFVQDNIALLTEWGMIDTCTDYWGGK